MKSINNMKSAAKAVDMLTHRRPDKGLGYWYRYVDRSGKTLGVYNGIKVHRGFDAVVVREEYPVLRVTPKGVVLDIGDINPRFVLDGTRKQFAHPDDKDALTSFVFRKKAQRRILRKQIDRADAAFIVGQEMLSKQP